MQLVPVIDQSLCGAKKRDGTPCPTSAMPNGRCRMHGGMSLSGIASPTFKTGRYAKGLGRLEERYQQAQNDPQLLGMRDEVALIDARLGDLLSRVDSGESGATWLKLSQLWRDFTRYRASGDVKNMQLSIEALGEPIKQGVADYAAWHEIGQLIDRRARLAEAERRRLELTEQTLTVEEAMGLLRTTLDVIQRHVTDRTTLSRIGADLARLVTLDAVGGAAQPRRSGKRRSK